MYDKFIAVVGKPFADEAWCADVVMLDHQGAHGPSLIWIERVLFDKLRALATSSGRIGDKPGDQQVSGSATSCRRPSRRYRSYPNKYWLLRQADAIVTVTTTKTIIREHARPTLWCEKRGLSQPTLSCSPSPTRRAPSSRRGRPVLASI